MAVHIATDIRCGQTWVASVMKQSRLRSRLVFPTMGWWCGAVRTILDGLIKEFLRRRTTSASGCRDDAVLRRWRTRIHRIRFARPSQSRAHASDPGGDPGSHRQCAERLSIVWRARFPCGRQSAWVALSLVRYADRADAGARLRMPTLPSSARSDASGRQARGRTRRVSRIATPSRVRIVDIARSRSSGAARPRWIGGVRWRSAERRQDCPASFLPRRSRESAKTALLLSKYTL